MNRFHSTIVEESSISTSADGEVFAVDEKSSDDQVQIHRRVPTRHSIKSLTGRKTLNKQNSVNEVRKRKT